MVTDLYSVNIDCISFIRLEKDIEVKQLCCVSGLESVLNVIL